MMELQIFSVYDSKAEAYLQPFFAPTRGSAIRSFSDAANDKEHDFRRHAADYTLFHVGSFDVRLGVVAPCEAPVSLGTALQYLISEEGVL